MFNPKNDNYFLTKIEEDLLFIVKHMTNVKLEDFQKNELLLDSMMFRLIQISENSQKLTNSYKQKHTNIPWHLMYALRNRIVHDYGNVDFSIIFTTLKNDIPELLSLIQTR